MSTSDIATPPPWTAPSSERVRLAIVALDAALRVPGVARAEAGPTGVFVTAGGEQRVEGVMCVAAPEGGYELSLRLVCYLVPLPALAQRIQHAVAEAGHRAGIAVAGVSVHIVEVVELEEVR